MANSTGHEPYEAEFDQVFTDRVLESWEFSSSPASENTPHYWVLVRCCSHVDVCIPQVACAHRSPRVVWLASQIPPRIVLVMRQATAVIAAPQWPAAQQNIFSSPLFAAPVAGASCAPQHARWARSTSALPLPPAACDVVTALPLLTPVSPSPSGWDIAAGGVRAAPTTTRLALL